MPVATIPWTAYRDQQLVDLLDAKKTSGDIAKRLGITRNAVLGRINRLRSAGDTRFAPAGLTAAAFRAHQMDALADAWANGAPTLGQAAHAAGLSTGRAQKLWVEVRRGLGGQAR